MAEETQTTEAPQVSIVDLQNVIQIIDAAAERGAFKGGEMSSVGTVRDRLAAFVEFAQKNEVAAAPTASSVDDAEQI